MELSVQYTRIIYYTRTLQAVSISFLKSKSHAVPSTVLRISVYMENNLHSAAGTDDIGRLWSLARGGGAADVDARDKAGDTPLHIAARVGNARAALLLLWLGADISVRTTLGGFTPLHLSLSNMHLLVSLIFIRAGALVRAYSSTHPIRAIPLDDVVDDEGRTPLQLLSLRLSRTAPPAMHREKREVYVWGECDIALGIPLPRAKYVVETPRRIDSISDAGVQSVVALQHSTGMSPSPTVLALIC